MLGKTFGAINIFFLGTCDGTDIRSTDGAADGKFEVLLICASLESLDGLDIGCNEVTEVCISCGIIIGITIGTYDITDLGLS